MKISKIGKNLLSMTFIILAANSCTETIVTYENLFPNSKASNYFKHSQSVTVEIYYEDGAEPFEGMLPPPNPNSRPLWSIVEDNIDLMFSYKSVAPTITVPTSLANMTVIPSQNRTTWSPENVIELYKQHHLSVPTQTSAVFYIYFLNGLSTNGSTTIAFSINTTPVIAVFKQVIENSGQGLGIQKFVEQSTIVHELGHAFGLVNNGVPMVVDHQDDAHGAHSTNTDCVMYYLNEGFGDLQDFYQSYITSGGTDTILWGPQVLDDVEAFSD